MNIGVWVRRERWGKKWHLVESVIADDAITRCGRRLTNEKGPLEISPVMPLTRMIGQPQLCKQCDVVPTTAVANAEAAQGVGSAT